MPAKGRVWVIGSNVLKWLSHDDLAMRAQRDRTLLQQQGIDVSPIALLGQNYWRENQMRPRHRFASTTESPCNQLDLGSTAVCPRVLAGHILAGLRALQ